MTFKFPAIDVTDRADDRIMYWDDAAGVHKYKDEAGAGAGAGTLVTFCRKTANESFSSTSFADSTNMGLAVAASKVYRFRFVIFYNTNATSVGIKLALTGPAGITGRAGVLAAIGAAGSGDNPIMSNTVVAFDDTPLVGPLTGPGSASGSVMALIEGLIVTDVTAGTLQLRHASETATATMITANSHGELIEIP